LYASTITLYYCNLTFYQDWIQYKLTTLLLIVTNNNLLFVYNIPYINNLYNIITTKVFHLYFRELWHLGAILCLYTYCYFLFIAMKYIILLLLLFEMVVTFCDYTPCIILYQGTWCQDAKHLRYKKNLCKNNEIFSLSVSWIMVIISSWRRSKTKIPPRDDTYRHIISSRLHTMYRLNCSRYIIITSYIYIV